MAEFSNLKDYLIKFEYPNVNFMDDEQIDEIFCAQNRHFLFKWLMKHINSQFSLAPLWSKIAQTFLADFLNQCGFCLPSEKLDFVQKSDSLSKTQEVEIFQRIFNFLQNTQEGGDKNQSTVDTVELQTFLKTDINLFPTLGEIKLRSSEKREEKVKYLTNGIESLRQKVDNSTEDDLNLDSCPWGPEETKRKLDDFGSNILKLRQVSSNFSSDTSDSHSFITDSKFKQELGDQLTICTSKTNELLKYFRNIKDTQIPDCQKLQDCKNLDQDEVLKLAQQLSENSLKIVKST